MVGIRYNTSQRWFRTVRVGAEVCRIPILYQSSGTAMLIWLHSYERTSAAKLFSSFFIVCSSLVELCDSIGNSKIQNLPIIITMKYFLIFLRLFIWCLYRCQDTVYPSRYRFRFCVRMGKKLRRGKLSEPAACGKRLYTCRILSWMRKESSAKSGTMK